MKSFQDNRSVVAFSLMPVTDFNEITYHMLDTIYSHLALTKVWSQSEIITIAAI